MTRSYKDTEIHSDMDMWIRKLDIFIFAKYIFKHDTVIGCELQFNVMFSILCRSTADKVLWSLYMRDFQNINRTFLSDMKFTLLNP